MAKGRLVSEEKVVWDAVSRQQSDDVDDDVADDVDYDDAGDWFDSVGVCLWS